MSISKLLLTPLSSVSFSFVCCLSAPVITSWGRSRSSDAAERLLEYYFDDVQLSVVDLQIEVVIHEHHEIYCRQGQFFKGHILLVVISAVNSPFKLQQVFLF